MIVVRDTPLPGLKVIEPKVMGDHRGFFMEVFKRTDFAEHGLPTDFGQANHSSSAKGVLRGLHFQWDPAMGKLMRVTRGAAYLMAVDIRPGSPTLGRWFGMTVDADTKLQIWGEPGFARGFYALSDICEIQYLCTGVYNPNAESGILWSDPAIGIEWPLDGEPTLSEKDAKAQTLAQWLARPEAQAFKVG